MSALLTSLPGDIPGLLLRGSLVRLTVDDCPAVIVAVGDDLCAVAYEDGGVTSADDDLPLVDTVLDLREEAGRAHAARWAMEFWRRMSSPQGALTALEQRVCRDALDYRGMDRMAVDDLARLVLRLAGRAF